MSILDSYDLNQHVVGATHRDGHTLDLIISRASDDGLVSNCCVGDCISDHFVVHCDLQFKKPPLERKEITCRKTRSIDFTDCCHKRGKSCLVLAPADDLEALVRQYNVTLKSMLDTHAPLKTRTVTVHPRILHGLQKRSPSKKGRGGHLSGAGGQLAYNVISVAILHLLGITP